MKVIYGKTGEHIKTPSVTGLGNFDGFHIGHMTLVNTIINQAKVSNSTSVVYTFEKHPENIMRKKLFTPLIITNNQKIKLLDKTGLDAVFFDEFTEELSRLKPDEFVKNVLLEKLNVKHVVAGYNYKFGYKAQGNVKDLMELGEKYGFGVTIIPPVKSGGVTVSSTNIRKNIIQGNIHKVFNLLGRHFSITGKVQTGKRIGKILGVPTANIYPEPYLVLPLNGVYITVTLLRGKLYRSITNVGVNPTVSDENEKVMETHILNFDEDIYNEYIEVYFLDNLRKEIKFKDIEELAIQLSEDIKVATNYFNKINFQ